jgi:C_GCAxxG_C_C family probable redox protein
VASFANEFALDTELALKVACGFGGGFAGLGGPCGAVTAGIMVIGLKYGKTKSDDEAAKEKTYRTVRDFVSRFEQRHGTILCRSLINADISTPEGLQAARDKQLLATVCPAFVRSAVEILQELLEKEPVTS